MYNSISFRNYTNRSFDSYHRESFLLVITSTKKQLTLKCPQTPLSLGRLICIFICFSSSINYHLKTDRIRRSGISYKLCHLGAGRPCAKSLNLFDPQFPHLWYVCSKVTWYCLLLWKKKFKWNKSMIYTKKHKAWI